jgi:hypothetical protein
MDKPAKEWDQDTPAYMSQNLFPKLTGAPYKRYVEIGEGTQIAYFDEQLDYIYH